MKRFFLVGSAVLSLAVVIFVVLLLRSHQPESAMSLQLTAAQASQCQINLNNFQAAYRVNVKIDSEFDQQSLYQSELKFDVQLQQASEFRIFGKASAIQINESISGQQNSNAQRVDDVLFLTKANDTNKLLFSEFDDLGLAAKHPMTILAQFIKNISVADSGQEYAFGYDSLKRNYRYQLATGAQFSRTLLSDASGRAPTQQMQTRWQVSLDQNCIPQTMTAEEVSPFGSGTDGFIRFSMSAERIADYENLLKTAYSPKANVDNQWQVATVQAGELTRDINSEKTMWQVFGNFPGSKDTGLLVKASDYLIDHVSALDLAALMANQSEQEHWRDMLFGLSLSHHAEVENYLLDLLAALPDNSGDAVDLQKVRVMVALGGSDQVTENSFQALSMLVDDRNETDNVRRNALISMGTVVQQMNNQQQDVNALSQLLTQDIAQQMQTEDASAAIYAAGNVGLDNLDNEVRQQVIDKLESDNEKDRFAAATVLVRDEQQYDLLVTHLETEKSALVSSAIVSGFDIEKLTDRQRSRLHSLAASSSSQIQEQINKLIGA